MAAARPSTIQPNPVRRPIPQYNYAPRAPFAPMGKARPLRGPPSVGSAAPSLRGGGLDSMDDALSVSSAKVSGRLDPHRMSVGGLSVGSHSSAPDLSATTYRRIANAFKELVGFLGPNPPSSSVPHDVYRNAVNTLSKVLIDTLGGTDRGARGGLSHEAQSEFNPYRWWKQSDRSGSLSIDQILPRRLPRTESKPRPVVVPAAEGDTRNVSDATAKRRAVGGDETRGHRQMASSSTARSMDRGAAGPPAPAPLTPRGAAVVDPPSPKPASAPPAPQKARSAVVYNGNHVGTESLLVEMARRDVASKALEAEDFKPFMYVRPAQLPRPSPYTKKSNQVMMRAPEFKDLSYEVIDPDLMIIDLSANMPGDLKASDPLLRQEVSDSRVLHFFPDVAKVREAVMKRRFAPSRSVSPARSVRSRHSQDLRSVGDETGPKSSPPERGSSRPPKEATGRPFDKNVDLPTLTLLRDKTRNSETVDRVPSGRSASERSDRFPSKARVPEKFVAERGPPERPVPEKTGAQRPAAEKAARPLAERVISERPLTARVGFDPAAARVPSEAISGGAERVVARPPEVPALSLNTPRVKDRQTQSAPQTETSRRRQKNGDRAASRGKVGEVSSSSSSLTGDRPQTEVEGKNRKRAVQASGNKGPARKKLREDKARENKAASTRKAPARHPESSDEEDVYVVEDLLDVMHDHQEEKTYYLIKWQDYPLEECTWEPEENLYDDTFIRKARAMKRLYGLKYRASVQLTKDPGSVIQGPAGEPELDRLLRIFVEEEKQRKDGRPFWSRARSWRRVPGTIGKAGLAALGIPYHQ